MTLSSGRVRDHYGYALGQAKAGDLVAAAADTALFLIAILLWLVLVKEMFLLVSVRGSRFIAAAFCLGIVHLQPEKPRQEGQLPQQYCIALTVASCRPAVSMSR